MQDFFDFMQRERWKVYQRDDRLAVLGNYLIVMDT